MEKREQRSDDSAGLTLPSLGCQLSPPQLPHGPGHWWDHPADAAAGPGRAGDAGKQSPGAAPAWKQPRASRGRGDAGWFGCWAPGGDGPSSAGSAPSLSERGLPSTLLASRCPKPSLPLAGQSILLPAAPAQGGRSTERLPGPRWAAARLPGAAGLGIPGPAGLGSAGHRGRPGWHLHAGAVPVTGAPGRALTIPCPLLPCLGWLPGGTVRFQVSVPGGLSWSHGAGHQLVLAAKDEQCNCWNYSKVLPFPLGKCRDGAPGSF